LKYSFRLFALAGLATVLMAAGPNKTLTISPGAAALFTDPAGAGRVHDVTATVGSGFTKAPVPNSEAGIPFVKNPNAKQAQLAPNLFSPPGTGYRGEGYIPSSSADAEQQRKVKPGAGVSLKVPLD
jgi:hypothetical protein